MIDNATRERVHKLIDEWRVKHSDTKTPVGLGFVSEDRFAKYGVQSRYTQITDAELVSAIRTNWQHKPGMNINPDAENVLLVICPQV